MNTRLTTAVAVLLFLVFAAPVSFAQSENEADSAAIKQVVQKIGAAWDHHDASAFAALYTDDAENTNLRGMVIHGRKNIEAFLANLFKGPLKNSSISDSIRSIRMLTPTVAIVDIDTLITTGAKTADGSLNPPHKGLMSLILAKQSGQWLIEIFHEQDLPTAPPATSMTK